MDEQEFKQLSVTDQVSCNGVLGIVVGRESNGEVRIHFDGDMGSTVLSARDLGMLDSLRVVRRSSGIHTTPGQRMF